MTKPENISPDPKPSWADAPALAQWLAMNKYGEWEFFNDDPVKFKGYWINNGTIIIEKRRDPKAPTFPMTKEKRPDVIEDYYPAPLSNKTKASIDESNESDEDWYLASDAENEEDY